MATAVKEVFSLAICLEGFYYGLYSGIFAMYLQCHWQSDKSTARTATIILYAVCLLYVLSTASFVSDLVAFILESRSNRSLLYLGALQIAFSCCCDFLTQGIFIYRCWIVWGQNISVVIIPSFLAITYLATSLASAGSTIVVQGQIFITDWGKVVALTGFSVSIAVNTLTTSLIVFKILKVSLEVKAALGSARGTKFRHIIFIIIESGMALFIVQLVRVVIVGLPPGPNFPLINDFLISMNEMFNGIAPTIILVRVSMRLSFDDEESFKEAIGSLCFNNPPSDPNALQRIENILPQDSERNEDICFNSPPNNPNTLQRVGSTSSSMPCQEMSGDT